MNMAFRVALLAATLAGACVETANAVQLTPSPAVAPDVAAFPRLVAAPHDRAAARINQALVRADARVRGAAQSCLAAGPSAATDNKPWWTRKVSVAMRGPAYLALVAADDWFCGGAYPNTGQVALVYDLRTGAPVNWARLLPASMVRATGTDTADDGTIVGTLASPALAEMYVKELIREDPDLAVCKDALTDPSFVLWPDAKHDGLGIAPFGLPHVIAACGTEIVIPTSTLRTLGVSPRLLEAIDAAHRAE